MALMPGQAKETMRLETTAKRPSYESILLEGEAKGADVSYFDGMVVSQFQAEPTYEKKVVPRKFQEARRARADRYYKALSLFLFFCIWEFISYMNAQNGWFNPVFLPSPVTVLETAYDYVLDGTLFMHIGVSFYRMITGFVLGVAAALIIGIWVAMSRDADNILSPVLNMIGPIPVFAFLPMFLIWFGIGEASKIKGYLKKLKNQMSFDDLIDVEISIKSNKFWLLNPQQILQEINFITLTNLNHYQAKLSLI